MYIETKCDLGDIIYGLIGKMVGLSQPHVRRVIRKFAKEVCSG